jgi:hypothetical protein
MDSSQVSAPDVVQMFKNVYGELHDLMPEDYKLSKDIPWSDDKMVGDKFIESVILGSEVGITLGGTGHLAYDIRPAVAGAVKQTEVSPYQIVLPSVIPWATVSRSAKAGEKAFFQATKHVVKNNLKSHGRFLEMFRLYGQSTYKQGRVSYATATYRGVALTNGGGTLSVKGANVTFTAGVNTSSKHILFHPGDFAAGLWVGMAGLKVQQILTSSGEVVAEGGLVAVDAANGVIQVDFTPVAATAEGSHHLGIVGQADTGEMIGIQKILSTVGTLFGINNSRFELFQGIQYPVTGKLTLAKAQLAIALCVNQGGLEEEDVTLYVNPRTWATMGGDEAALREYDSSYDPAKAERGFKYLVYYSQNGRLTVKAHRMVKEGDAFALCLPYWSRSGSAEASFRVPGSAEDLIFPLENQAGWAFRSFSDQYIFCAAPAKQIYFSGINDESTT